jgi:ATP-dependent helicase HrpB
LDYLQGCFRYEQLCWLDDQAPESIVVPSGNRIRVEYAADKPPVLAVRIQEIFGWQETPRLAGGKVAVQLHLLAPNRRPQQITEDLPSFWETTYHQIRKDLRRRYAKHHWPEDPGNATATRNGLKPKK